MGGWGGGGWGLQSHFHVKPNCSVEVEVALHCRWGCNKILEPMCMFLTCFLIFTSIRYCMSVLPITSYKTHRETKSDNINSQERNKKIKYIRFLCAKNFILIKKIDGSSYSSVIIEIELTVKSPKYLASMIREHLKCNF